MINYKKLIYLLLLISISVKAQSNDVFGNKDCIKMHKAGFSSELIISKISSLTKTNFDISIDGIIDLKNAGLNESVIKVIMEKQESQSSILSAFTFNYKDKLFTVPGSGIYFLSGNDLTELNPTSINSNSARPGVFNIKQTSEIEGASANYKISKNSILFFIFDDVEKSLNDSNANSVVNKNSQSNNFYQQGIQAQKQMMSDLGLNTGGNQKIVSPNEFKLIRLDVKKNSRKFIGGRFSPFGQFNPTIKDKNLGVFSYKKIKNNIFVVEFDSSNSPGEYCFMYAGNIQQSGGLQRFFGMGNNVKVFDFTLR